ncbi:hypothetical protein PSV09DRAFT_2405658 [Bipolaris maydis]|nr:hypothetical protein J3E74DRAFT_442255 [Bipolaris maydis]KAJ6214201.1 hypothetical protein PSV09DRAFT_2405658 [Bipolaris maydis]
MNRSAKTASEDLLNDVSSQLDEKGKHKIQEVLASFEDDTPPPLTPSVPSVSHSKRQRQRSYFDDDGMSSTSADVGEALVSASVGSNDDLDFVQEDLLRVNEAESAGFMGRNSQAQWLRALESQVEQPEDESSFSDYGPPGASAEAFNQRAEALHGRQQKSGHTQANANSATNYYFYLDKTNIDIEIDDPDVLPSPSTAQSLFGYYKHAVHSPFKLVDDEFEQQLQVYLNEKDGRVTENVCSKWKAVMNLVFAIGARYSYLVDAEWRADDRDHLVYMWRAIHLLQLQNIRALVSHPEQRLIQAAGLHLRYENPSIPNDRRNSLAELWWALNSIECVLTAILGRPRVISANDCTVPPPGTVRTETELKSRGATTGNVSTTTSVYSRGSGSSTGEKSAAQNSDNFAPAYVRLDILMDKILAGLYSPRRSARSWKGAQSMITSLSEELETWALQWLPQGASAAAAATVDHSLDRERLLLYLYYYNAKICITRPCVCRMDERIKGQSAESSRFNQKTAEACIGAALDIAALLPDVPKRSWFYANGPWWCATHMIMQALTPLLIELSLDCVHLTIDKSHVTSCVEKLIAWLHSMKTVDAVSESAYNVATKVLSRQRPEDATKKQMPHPEHHQALGRQEYGPLQQQPDSQQSYQIASHPYPLQEMEYAWPGPDELNSMPYFPQPDARRFYQNNAPSSEFLHNSNTGMHEFGQPQMSLFYANPFTATMDQWDWDSTAGEDTGHGHGPGMHQYQGQNFGGRPSQ